MELHSKGGTEVKGLGEGKERRSCLCMPTVVSHTRTKLSNFFDQLQ